MSKKINWYAGKNPNNPADMQEICDEVANATDVQNLAEKIKGSESVIVDVAEDEQSLEIHLDAEVTSDISRSLKTPVSAPTDTSIVAVDSANAQTMLKIGDGLSVENGELSASGSGGYYRHVTRIYNTAGEYSFFITFNSSTKQYNSIYQLFTENTGVFLASGILYLTLDGLCYVNKISTINNDSSLQITYSAHDSDTNKVGIKVVELSLAFLSITDNSTYVSG